MANHITNIILFKDDIKDKIINEDCYVDFNVLIPMPPASDTFFRGNIGKDEKEKFGENNWYDWSIANWGTKWNAYEQSVWIDKDNNSAKFLTAWCYPHQWLEKLAYAGDFTLLYADECIGHNCGIIEARDGMLFVDNCSLERYERIALSLYVKREDPYDYADWITQEGEKVDADLAEVCANYKDILSKILPDGFDLP